MIQIEFTERELTAMIDALELAASRRESQGRVAKHGRHHDQAAEQLRRLRFRFIQRRSQTSTARSQT
jgi:hypothetical protein